MKRVQRPRILVTPSQPVWKLLEAVHKETGKAKAAIVSEILDAVAPLFQEQLETARKVAREPERARELVSEYGWQSVQAIAQAQLDLPPARKERRRRKSHDAP
jgi:hypothetical protein